jgi:hypothetical protein
MRCAVKKRQIQRRVGLKVPFQKMWEQECLGQLLRLSRSAASPALSVRSSEPKQSLTGSNEDAAKSSSVVEGRPSDPRFAGTTEESFPQDATQGRNTPSLETATRTNCSDHRAERRRSHRGPACRTRPLGPCLSTTTEESAR